MRRAGVRRASRRPAPDAPATPAAADDADHAGPLHRLVEVLNDVLAQPVLAEAAGGARSTPTRLRPPTVGRSGGDRSDRSGRPDRSDRTATDLGGSTDTAGSAAGYDAGHVETIADDHIESWRLVERAQQGDGEAFGLLYDRYVDMVYRFVYYRINDRTLAEDFTSETFLRALRRIGSITYQGRDIGAWFVTIARNIVLDHVKSARNRLESTTGEVLESKEHVQSTENAVLTTLQNEQLMAAVAKLGDEQRECVTLRFVHGLSVNETASIMGKNDGAIKALQHRAVRKLADLVDHQLR